MVPSAFMETTMTQAKDIVPKLEACIKIAHALENHNSRLVQELAVLGPSNNTVKAQLLQVGFGTEITNEDNLKLLLDHHTNLVAENTKLHKTITNRDSLMEQLRTVVMENAD